MSGINLVSNSGYSQYSIYNKSNSHVEKRTSNSNVETSRSSWGTPLSELKDKEGPYSDMLKNATMMMEKTPRILGGEFGFIQEVVINGKTSKERSLTDQKMTYTNYGYSCYINEGGEPYMVYEDELSLAKECEEKGECFTQKYNEILGKDRILPDGSRLVISDSYSIDGVEQGRHIFIGKNNKLTSIPVGNYSYKSLYYILDNLKETKEIISIVKMH